MVNKYERPTAYGGITVEKTQLQSFGSVQEISTVYLWYLQTVYEVNDYRSSNKQKEEEEISQITDVSVCVCVCVVAIGIITGCECIVWLSSSGKKNKKPGFCISLAMTCQALLFKCSQ